jgi:hypothetical protein
MKLKASTLILGLCLAMLAVAASPAYAASTTGFSSFHVEYQWTNEYKNATFDSPYDCLIENYGAVLNQCGQDVSLVFDLPITSSGNHTIQVQDYWYGWPGNTSFTCDAYSYAGTSGSVYAWGSLTFYEPGQNLPVNVGNGNGMSIQLICWNVPPGGGIAQINWNM